MKDIDLIHPIVGKPEVDAVSAYLQSGGWITEHKQTAKFEGMICEYLGVKYACVVPSGTVGLYLALLACGIEKREVLLPNLTMIATANAAAWAGNCPVLVDISPDDFCLDVEKIEERDRVPAAMVYVGLNGRSRNMQKVVDYCQKNNIVLIEDACQAFGSKSNGKLLGTFGTVGVYSLSPHKIMTTGQGGVIVTNEKGVFDRVKQLKDFGRVEPGVDWHISMGYNFKFTDLQAALGIQQLIKVPFAAQRKVAIYEKYREALYEKIPRFMNDEVPWFIELLCGSNRERISLANFLSIRGIKTRPFYPTINNQPIYHKTDKFPVSEDISARGLWLPSSIDLTDDDIRRVSNTICKFYKDAK